MLFSKLNKFSFLVYNEHSILKKHIEFFKGPINYVKLLAIT